MPDTTLRIITRESPLAMWQACHVRDRLQQIHPGLDIRILGITTEADRFLDSTLASLGGKGAFVKELEHALLHHHADIAVHSMKDVTVDLPDGLAISAILTRENPGDAFVSGKYTSLQSLPDGAVVGTSSLRRQCQLNLLRPDLVLKDIRGNVGTRLGKLDSGFYDALGIEVRATATRTRELIAPLNDPDTHLGVSAERRVNKQLNGGCHAPVAAYATRQGDTVSLSGLVGHPDGSIVVRASVSGPYQQADSLGDELGQLLLDQGAGRILEQLRLQAPA